MIWSPKHPSLSKRPGFGGHTACSAIAALVVLAGAGVAAMGTGIGTQNNAAPAPAQEKKTEEVYKNIQVLKGLPQSELLNAMFFMRSSLNTDCGHCHDWKAFEKDDKPAKQIARKMILMVRDLNNNQFDGRRLISCNTCHRGSIRPDAPLAFAVVVDEKKASVASSPPAGTLPDAMQLFDRHLQAIGGAAALQKITSRVWKGTRLSSEGWSAPLEIDQRAPNLWMDSFILGGERWIKAFNGTSGWGQDNHGLYDVTRDLADLKQESEFYRDLELKELCSNPRSVGREVVNGQDAYIVEATMPAGAQKLYFSVKTGLLIRIAGFVPSIFGPIPNAIDYEDYREVDGIKVPFIISHMRPDFSLKDRFTEIRQNVSFAEKQFDKPAAKLNP